MAGHNPNRVKGLNRVNRLLKNLPKRVTSLRDGNNSSTLVLMNALSAVIYIARLNNITLHEMGFIDLVDHNRRAKSYYNILSGLYLLGRPSTITQVMDMIGSDHKATKPIISKLLTAGYIREKRTAKQSNFLGSSTTRHLDGIELTAKGLDKLIFINSLLSDTSQFTRP